MHTRDPLYTTGRFNAVWTGLTAVNNDGEVQLNTSTPVGLNCNVGIPSHNFFTSAPDGEFGPHDDANELWNEDVHKFMLID